MRESEMINRYIGSLVDLMTTPYGLACVALLIGAIVAAIRWKNARWVFLALALFVVTLPAIDIEIQVKVLAFPLEQLRQVARPSIYVFLGLLLLPLLTSERGWRHQVVSWPLILLFTFELGIGVRLCMFGGELRGVTSLVTFSLMLLTLGFGLARWLQTMEDLHRLLWALSTVGLLSVACCGYQLVVNRTPILVGARLWGIAGNPQFFGILIAHTLPVTCYLLTRAGGRRWTRPVLLAQAGVTIVMLLWTGSRIGAASTAAALLITFHRRVGRLLIAGTLLFVLVMLILPYFEGSSDTAMRLVSTTNSRQGVADNLLRIFRENLLFGESRESFRVQESSFLSSLAEFGLLGALPFFAAAVGLIGQSMRLWTLRKYLGPNQGVADLLIGLWTAVLVSAMFEAFLVGVVTYSVFFVYVFTGMTVFLLDWCQTTRAALQYEVEHDALLTAA